MKTVFVMSKSFLFCNSNKSDMFHLILAVWIWCTFKFCAVEFIKMGGFLKKHYLHFFPVRLFSLGLS